MRRDEATYDFCTSIVMIVLLIDVGLGQIEIR
jgi:hypothetical protein